MLVPYFAHEFVLMHTLVCDSSFNGACVVIDPDIHIGTTIGLHHFSLV